MLLTAEEIEKLNSFDRRKPKPKPKRRRVPEPVVPAPEPKGKRKRAAEEEEADPPPQKKKPRPASEDTPSQQVTSLIREQGKLAKELATKKRKERQLQKEITDLEAAQNRVLAQRRTLQKQSKRGPAKKAAAAAQPAPKAGRPRSPPQAKAAKKPAPKKKGAKVLQAEAQPAVPALIPGISVDAILAHYALDDLRRFAAKHDFALEVREKRKAPLANDIHTFLATGRLPVHNDVTAPAPQEAKTGKGKRRVARPPRQPVPKNPPDAAEAHDDAKEAAPPGGAAEPAPADPQPQAQADSAPAAAVDGAEDPAADDAAKPADKPAPDGKKEAAKPAPKPKGKKK